MVMIRIYVLIFTEKLVMQVFLSVCLDDAKKLYSGFDLVHALTSVSMTINGPAPMLLGFYECSNWSTVQLYIKANALESWAKKLKRFIKKRYLVRFITVPVGNDGLGLYLLGVTGDQVLPADVYNEIK
jgi:methylmalonyl-CoA mutase